MDLELKKLLEDNLQIANENKAMLKRLVLLQKWNQIIRITYWVLLIGIAIGAFYTIEPYFNALFGMSSSGGVSGLDSMKDLFN